MCEKLQMNYNFFVCETFQCDNVLEIDPNNVKAYYRRGTSHLEAGDAQSAMEDFMKVWVRL